MPQQQPEGLPEYPPTFSEEIHEDAEAPKDLIKEIHQLASAEKAYDEAIDTVKKLFANIEKTKQDINLLLNIARKTTALLIANNEELIILCTRTTPNLYLYSHSVNTCILSTALAIALGYSSDDLEKIALSALLHDTGMIKIVSVVSKSSKVSQHDFNEIKKHPNYSRELLENVDMSPQTKTFLDAVITQVHERKDGSGYPKGLSGEQTNVIAKIVSICDVYEALTHPRSWREAILPHEALKKMIDMADADFDMNMVKLFIEKISLYPIGSYVRLNDEQVARVISSNPGLPTRPNLKIIVDCENKKVSDQKFVDLRKSSVLYITKCVDETMLKLEDKKLVLELKARRWWVKNI
ncbi:MAG: HD domain-containing protein [Elusimicrobia bacterium]|nr:HD domain-containing protein [Elusimicrobiota bacterium]